MNLGEHAERHARTHGAAAADIMTQSVVTVGWEETQPTPLYVFTMM
jgi:hypothetical protein